MADKKDGISRLGFFKVAGLVAATYLGEKIIRNIDENRADNIISSIEVNNDDKLLCEVPGREGTHEVVISYRDEAVGKLQLRTEGGITKWPIKFNSGSETRRTIGEITELKIKKVRVSGEIPEGYYVKYHTIPGPLVSEPEPTYLNNDAEYDLLPVITHTVDGLGDGKLPKEINSSKYYSGPYASGESHEIKHFAQGGAVGHFNSENNTFTIIGYLYDDRLVEEVK